MKKIAVVAAFALLALACSGDRSVNLTVEVPFGMAQASPAAVFFPSADGVNFLDTSRSRIASSPCYVKVYDEKAGAQTECTATSHTLLYRFTWKAGGRHLLKFRPSDLGHGPMNVMKTGPVEICASGGDFFSVVRFSSEIVDFECGPDAATVSFGDGSGSVAAVAGLSYTALVEAKTNLTSEASDDIFDLDAAAAESAAMWNSVLNVSVSGGSGASKAALEAGLRRSANVVSVFSDRRHTYRNRNGEIVRARFDNVYSKPGDWTEVRAWTPLAALLYPTVLTDFCLSCCDMYGTEGEYMPFEAYPVVASADERGMLSSLNREYWELAKENLGEVPSEPDFSASDTYRTLSLIGLVPDRAPGTGYTFCAPAFKTVSIRLGTGNDLVIKSKGARRGTPRSVLFNGVALEDCHISLEAILGGGEIVIIF